MPEKPKSNSKNLQEVFKIEEVEDSDRIRQPFFEKSLLGNSTQSWRDIVLVLTMLFFWLTLRCMVTISAQVSGIKSNIFKLNSLRFALQFLAATLIVLIRKDCLTISREPIHLLAGGVIFNLTFATCISIAPSFIAVGYLDALFVAFYIILSMLYDVLRRSIGLKAVVTSLIVVIGIIIVAQPWNSVEESPTLSSTPCEYLDGGMVIMDTNDITTSNGTLNGTDTLKGYQTIIDTNDTATFNGTLNDRDTLKDPPSPFKWGYILLIAAAFGSTAAGNCVKKLLVEYSVPTLMFWLALFEGLISLAINITVTGLTDGDYYSFPVGTYCLLFTSMFIIGSAVAHCLSYIVYSYLYISTIAVASVYISIMLYISQRTFLKAFHPGHANIIEVAGIMVVIFGAAFFPLIFVFLEKKDEKTVS